MGRNHSLDDYMLIINELKKANPLIKFSSDFIIGYPGETDKDFEETLRLLEKVSFINSYSYIYSPRPGTPAATMKKTDITVAKNRLLIFQKTAEKIKMKYRKRMFSKISSILFENKIGNRDEFFGRDEYLNSVIVKSEENLIGRIEKVKIYEGNQSTLFGKIEDFKNKNFAA